MIVDLMRNDIGRVAVPGSVRVPELFVVEPFPAVHHLVSTITARLPATLHASDLLRAAFPGGSITGAPKVRAMEIIDELEPQRRNAWCGSIGYLSYCGNMDTSITIRTLTAWQGNCIAPLEAVSSRTARKMRNIRKLLIKLIVSCTNWRTRPWRTTPSIWMIFLSRFQLLRSQPSRHALNQRQAAVLVPIVRRPQPGLLLTQRSPLLRKHRRSGRLSRRRGR